MKQQSTESEKSNNIPGQGLLLMMIFLFDGLWMYVIVVGGEGLIDLN